MVVATRIAAAVIASEKRSGMHQVTATVAMIDKRAFDDRSNSHHIVSLIGRSIAWTGQARVLIYFPTATACEMRRTYQRGASVA